MKHFKYVKFFQLALSILFDIVFFVVLLAYPELKYTVFTNRPLTILCIFIWVLCIGTFLFLLYDIQKILEIEITHHELNKEAYLDDLTGIPNRHSLDLVFQTHSDKKDLSNMGCGIFMLSNLVSINNEKGHEAGDQMIQNFSALFEEVGDHYGFVGRNSGNKYLAFFEECTKEKMETFQKDLNDSIKSYNQNNTDCPIFFQSAYVLNSELHVTSMTDLIGQAYQKLV